MISLFIQTYHEAPIVAVRSETSSVVSAKTHSGLAAKTAFRIYYTVCIDMELNVNIVKYGH